MSELEYGKTYFIAVKAGGDRGDGNIGVQYKNFSNTTCYPTFRPDQLIDPKAAQPKWQPIETAPKDGTRILVTDGDHIDMAYWDYGTWCAPHSTSNDIPQTPTHWQPSPKPPSIMDPRYVQSIYAARMHNARCKVLELTNGEYMLFYRKLIGWKDIRHFKARVKIETLELMISCIDMVRDPPSPLLKFDIKYMKPVIKENL